MSEITLCSLNRPDGTNYPLHKYGEPRLFGCIGSNENKYGCIYLKEACLLVLSDVLLPISSVKLDVLPFDRRILPSLAEHR